MIKLDDEKVELFLRESNAIEGVYDDDSFQQALEAWNFLLGNYAMTPGVILKAHKILMLHQPLQPDERGYFRICEVMIGNRYGANAITVPDRVFEWCHKGFTAKWQNDPIQMHVEFEEIHPFVDGNGRTGRLLLNWQKFKRMDEDIVVFTEADKYNYYKLFK